MVAFQNMLQTKGRLPCADDNALDKENEDGSVTEGNWRKGDVTFLVNILKNENK